MTSSATTTNRTPPPATYLAFHHDAKLYTLATVVTAVRPFSALDEANRLLFKHIVAQQQGEQKDDDLHEEAFFVVVTEKTIFHPQGGGQPSDVGSMELISSTSSTTSDGTLVFDVQAVRMDALHDGQVLHFGRFSSSASTTFHAGQPVHQAIDVPKRTLYSRLHTAGHVLGAAVRHVVVAAANAKNNNSDDPDDVVPGFAELKASHFPGAAACEFAGLLAPHWKDPVQRQVDAYVAAALPVQVDWWDAAEFRRQGLERLLPPPPAPGSSAPPLPPGHKFRVVRIVGADVYPCGGTHVDSTDLCGETKVKKISRSKGQSRVSYTVE